MATIPACARTSLGSSVLETNTSGVVVNDEQYFAYGNGGATSAR